MHGHSLLSFLVSLRILQPLVIFSSVISFLGGDSWPFSRAAEPCLSQSRAQTQHTCPAADVPQIQTVAEQGWTCHSLKWTKLLEWGTQHFKQKFAETVPWFTPRSNPRSEGLAITAEKKHVKCICYLRAFPVCLGFLILLQLIKQHKNNGKSFAALKPSSSINP